MYNPTQIAKGIRDPRKILLELNKIYHRNVRGRKGIKVMEKDWDNLIILDACRYDLFEEVNTTDGKLTSVISSDSSTSGFLKYNFRDDYFPDTVYISANPQVQRHGVESHFHDCIRLWEDNWNNELKTVHPRDVTDKSLDIQKKYPNKRHIIHYIQPHYPFIGETGKKIEHRTVTGDGVIENEEDISSVWYQLETGTLDRDIVWKAYRENLEIVLEELDRLLEALVGKSVVTSDHGNALGELGVYGHPSGVYLHSLVRVPWLEFKQQKRRKIKDGKINESKPDDRDISEHLKHLGYVD